MAQKIQTLFIDDLDAGPAEGTVRFALDGTDYEIDLSARHGDELCAAPGKYVEHARKIGGTARRPGARGARKPSGRHDRRPGPGAGQRVRHQEPRPRARQPRRQVPGSDRNPDKPGSANLPRRLTPPADAPAMPT
ncbi:MAG: Lsr2 family protein [Trebonia sp.]